MSSYASGLHGLSNFSLAVSRNDSPAFGGSTAAVHSLRNIQCAALKC